jgi:hypothetical protein
MFTFKMYIQIKGSLRKKGSEGSPYKGAKIVLFKLFVAMVALVIAFGLKLQFCVKGLL